MHSPGDQIRPRHKRWPPEARHIVANFLAAQNTIVNTHERRRLRILVDELTKATGFSRQTCLRFARRLGVRGNQPYRGWTRSDQQRLLDLIALHPPHEVAKIMRRTPGSVRTMLHRLGATAQMGRDWFTKYTLAEALHIRVAEVERWVEVGWLKVRKVQTGRLTKDIIDADDFSDFCKRHGAAVVGRRLHRERLEFVRNFVFPPSHTELLPVRESKKERAAYEAQLSGKFPPETEDEDGENDIAIA